ncbi:MAG: hypothetical protein ACE5E5_01455 [Phycisphaerae bacterium]
MGGLITNKWLAALCVAVLGFVLPATSRGAINLELRPRGVSFVVGDTIDVDLYAVSDDPNADQSLSGVQIIVQWNADDLQLLGHGGPASGDWILAGFFDDSQIDGLNDSLDDGDAYYQAAAAIPGPLWATPEGLLITTLSFHALAATENAQIHIPAQLGQFTESAVFGPVPGVTVTGTLGTVGFPVTSHPVWGLLRISADPNVPCVRAGESITVLLQVANLLEPINGVQALFQYDTAALTLLDVLTGDGAGSPWDAAVPLHSNLDGGVAILVVLFGDASVLDAAVARVRFVALADITPASAIMQMTPNLTPLSSTLTVASTGMTIIPGLEGPAVMPPVGDTDVDGDIDLLDSGALAGCAAGPDVPPFGDCGCSDFDQDGDVDLRDFADLQIRFGGPS